MRFALFEDALRRYPRRGEAALLYADELVHRGPLAGIPLDSGLAMMQTAGTANSSRPPSSTRRRVRPHRRQGPGGHRPAPARCGRRDVGRRGARRRRLIGFVRSQRFQPWWAAVKLRYIRWTADSLTRDALSRYVRLGNMFDIPDGQIGFGQMLAEKGETAALRGSGHEAQGLALCCWAALMPPWFSSTRQRHSSARLRRSSPGGNGGR